MKVIKEATSLNGILPQEKKRNTKHKNSQRVHKTVLYQSTVFIYTIIYTGGSCESNYRLKLNN